MLYAFHGQENEWNYMFERGSWVGDCVWRLIAFVELPYPGYVIDYIQLTMSLIQNIVVLY